MRDEPTMTISTEFSSSEAVGALSARSPSRAALPAQPPRTPAARPAPAYGLATERLAPAHRPAQVLTALGVASADALLLEREARVRLVAQGQAVFDRGEPAHTAVLLLQGDVALGLTGEDAAFRPERLVHAPAWLDLAAVWLDMAHATEARAMSLAAVAEWPPDVLAALVERRPALARVLIEALARQVQTLVVHTQELMHLDAPARLAVWLHQRCEPDPAAPGRALVRLAERKRDIASQLAITPETLSRLMRSFMRQGVIEVSGYTVQVLDPRALAALARGGE
jgi:CRP-like cAMP-binding protein